MTEESTVQARVSILNPPASVTALKFKSWLRRELQDISQTAGSNQFLLVRLYVPKSIYWVVGEKEVDRILRKTLNEGSAIQDIELRLTDQPLTLEEMDVAIREAQAELRSLEEVATAMDRSDEWPEQWWGYDRPAAPGDDRLTISIEGMVCMVSNITPVNVDGVRASSGMDFKNGDWFVSANSHQNAKVSGPFKTVEDAFDFGRHEYRAIRYKTLPR